MYNIASDEQNCGSCIMGIKLPGKLISESFVTEKRVSH